MRLAMPASRSKFAAASLILAAIFATSAAKAEDVFTLTSTTFADGKIMPLRVANSKVNRPDSPNCVGENVSPQFSWSNVPNGTKSFALLMFDPEGGAPLGVSHWVAYGIAATVTGFAEGEVSKDSDKYVGGKSTMGVGHYSGPCTPAHVSPHHYTFILIASDFEPNELPPGLSRDEVIAKFGPARAHLKGSTGMVGLFVNPWHE
jgi:Raf kinase inhibitor-like YbhB/YbcL family protein